MLLEYAVLLTRNVHPFSSHLINSSCHPLRFNLLFSHPVMSDSLATPWIRISQARILGWVAISFYR